VEFTQFAAAHGLEIRHLEHGKIARCPTKDNHRKGNGAYLLMGDWGWVQNWQTMTEPTYWKDESIIRPEALAALNSRMEASRKQYAQERAKEAAEAAKRAQTIISASILENHAYLDSKGIKDSGMVWYPNHDTNLLVIPMRINGVISGVQLINRDGNKKFLKGQRTNGAEYIFGTRGVDWLVEGYATGKSLKESLDAFKINARIHVCFSAGNLARIGKSMKKAFICCDNDVSETGEKAAIETGHPYYMPYTKGDDLNDQWQRDGTFKTGMALQKWLIDILPGLKSGVSREF
jgi:putative DNA primase/helicase